MASTALSRATPLIWVRSPNRKLTASACTSRSPASNMNGTLWPGWWTIFFLIRSVLAATFHRTACRLDARRTPFQIGYLFVGDRDADHLNRRQPRRERPRVVLGEDAEEPLDRPEERSVDHHRAPAGPVRGGVLELETLREIEVHL